MARPAGHDSFEPNGELSFIFSIWSQKGHTGADYLLLTFTFSSLIAKKCTFTVVDVNLLTHQNVL